MSEYDEVQVYKWVGPTRAEWIKRRASDGWQLIAVIPKQDVSAPVGRMGPSETLLFKRQ